MMATSTIVALALAAAAAGGSYYNTQQTAKRQDDAAAAGIRDQGKRQKEADAKVNGEVQKLKDSDAADERASALQSYMTTLAQHKQTAQAGLNTPNIGGAAFQAGSEKAAGEAAGDAANTAGLMARIDAPGMQRQGEGFDYGNLATDLSLIGRQAQGDDFLNQLRIRAIRRNPYIDAAAAGMNAYAGATAGGGGGASAAGAQSGATNVGSMYAGLGALGY